MPAKRAVILAPQGEFDRCHQRGRGYITERVRGHIHDIHHDGNPAPRPDIGLGPAAGHMRQRFLDRPRQPHGVLCHASAQTAARAPHEQHRTKRGFAILGDAVRDDQQLRRNLGGLRDQVIIQREIGPLLSGGRDHQQPQPRPGSLRVSVTQDGQRVFDIGAAPSGAGVRHLKIPSRRGPPPVHADARGGHIQPFARLVFCQHAGDVIIDNDDLVHMPVPLFGEHPDGR